MRTLVVVAAVTLALADLPVHEALAQNLSGSFTSNNSGETFTIEGNGDGTADIYSSDGRYVGQAQNNNDGSWDIESQSSQYLGQIQDNSEGSFDVYGSLGIGRYRSAMKPAARPAPRSPTTSSRRPLWCVGCFRANHAVHCYAAAP